GGVGRWGVDGVSGWPLRWQTSLRLAYLSLVCSRPAEAERHLRETIRAGGFSDATVEDLGRVMTLRGAPEADVLGMYSLMLKDNPRLVDVRRILAVHELESQRPEA